MIRMLARLLGQGVRDLALNPWAQASTLGAVVLVAFMSGLFLMALTTLDYQLSLVRGETVFQVYWKPGADMEQVRGQWEQYRSMPGLLQARTFTPEEALSELGSRLDRAHGGLEQKFPFLAGKSPLPATALLSFSPTDDDLAAWISETSRFLAGQPDVERVVTTPLRDELGRAWRKVSRFVVWPSVVLLCLVLGLVVGNTVRLSMAARANEIEILQLSGAYNWYIRLPLMIGGSILAMGGSLIALLLLRFMHSQIRDVLNFPPLLMEVLFLPWGMSVALVLVPTLTAATASWLAVRGD